jgi:hypothetical protein
MLTQSLLEIIGAKQFSIANFYVFQRNRYSEVLLIKRRIETLVRMEDFRV